MEDDKGNDNRAHKERMVDDLLTVVLYAHDRRPADPEVAAALSRLAIVRRDLMRERGVEDEDISDPRGHLPRAEAKAR